MCRRISPAGLARLAGLPRSPSSVTLIFFFQLRACDEVKDAEDDRALPPGAAGAARAGQPAADRGAGAWPAMPVAVAGGGPARGDAAARPLALVWLWLALMAVSSSRPHWLKARPFLYLVSHMADHAVDRPVRHGLRMAAARPAAPPRGLWLFLVLSFVNGCVLEIGRKIYAPQNERTGVETYSALLGPRTRDAALGRRARRRLACLLVASACAVGAPRLVGTVGPRRRCAACLSGGWAFLARAGRRRRRSASTRCPACGC